MTKLACACCFWFGYGLCNPAVPDAKAKSALGFAKKILNFELSRGGVEGERIIYFCK
jgi:hypothetical protein